MSKRDIKSRHRPDHRSTINSPNDKVMNQSINQLMVLT
jgi:hypothetical protein